MNINSSSGSYVSKASSNKGFSGLASGMDTDSMVEALLSGTQAKIDKQNAIKQQTIWKQEIYREIISSMNTFRNKYFNSASSTNFMNSSFFNAMNAVANSTAFGVTATSSALSGTTTVSVEQLATASKVTSAPQNRDLAGELDLAGVRDTVLKESRDVTFMVNGETVTVDFKDLYKESGGQISEPNSQDVVDRLNASLARFNGVKAELNKSGEIVITSTNEKDTISVASSSSKAGLQLLGLSANANASKDTIEVEETGDDGSTTTTKKDIVSLTGTRAVDTGIYFSVDVTINDIKNTIQVDMSKVTDAKSFETAFNDSMQASFGSIAKMEVSNTAEANGKFSFKFVAFDASSEGIFNSSKIMISGDPDTVDPLGVLNGQSNRIGLGGSLEMYFKDAFDSEGNATFSINGKEITVNKDMTVGDLIRKVNASGAGVTLSYQAVSDTFTFTSNSTGAGFKIDIADDASGNSSLMQKMFGAEADRQKTDGTNAVAVINGQRLERSTNNISYDGLNITLKEVSQKQADGTYKTDTITTSRDTDKIVDGIKAFIKDYNELIGGLNELISEDTNYRDYAPLTDAQKKEMTEKEITLWEEKAKQGLLRSDSTISNFLQSMRTELYQRTAGGSLALYDLGIETGEWEEKGKLVMSADGEAKLRQMLESNSEEIVKLFTDEEDGLAVRLDTILKNNASTSYVSTGSNGVSSRGALVELAGVKGSASETQNTLYKRLDEIETKIKNLKSAYELEKNRYWNKFNAMEKMISQMSSQSAWLSQQFMM